MKTQKSDWEKRKPIGNYWIEIGPLHRVSLYHKDGRSWGDTVRAMSHLMHEIFSQNKNNMNHPHTTDDWENEFDKRFTRKSKGGENKGKFMNQWFVRETTTAGELKDFIRSQLSKVREEEYVRGYKEGSGGMAANVLALHDQYEKGVKAGREEVLAKTQDDFYRRLQIDHDLPDCSCKKCKKEQKIIEKV